MEEYREKFYEIDGHKIHVMESGRVGRQVALHIHGWSSSWYATKPVMDLLTQRFHCIAVDLPGYGDSPPFPDRVTIPKYADYLAKLIEQVTDSPVVLVGHSMGGMTSVTLAKKYPELVERMVLLSPTITGHLSNYINVFITPITVLERFPLTGWLVRAVEGSVAGITDQLMRPASFAQRTGITKEDYAKIRGDARRQEQGRVRAECFLAMRENDLRGKLSDINTPTLVIWGAEDNTVPLSDAGVIADEWPGADLRILPQAGHWPHFEMTELVRKITAAYLGLPRSSSDLYTPVDEKELVRVDEVAQFLAHSAIGTNMNLAQRTRLAAQCTQRTYRPGQTIVHATDLGQELYIIQKGTVEVWQEPELISGGKHEHRNLEKAAVLRPGQITGEMAMLDQGGRSADLLAGPDGATILSLKRERLLTLSEDDAVLGTRLLWNLATAVSRRARFILWQLNREREKGNNAS